LPPRIISAALPWVGVSLNETGALDRAGAIIHFGWLAGADPVTWRTHDLKAFLVNITWNAFGPFELCIKLVSQPILYCLLFDQITEFF
jgi:hypothetical protein